MRGWPVLESMRVLVLAALVGLLGLTAGCSEKRRCYFQCYETSLKDFGDGCGYVEDVTQEYCNAMRCSETRHARVSWGPLPTWCPDDPAAR